MAVIAKLANASNSVDSWKVCRKQVTSEGFAMTRAIGHHMKKSPSLKGYSSKLRRNIMLLLLVGVFVLGLADGQQVTQPCYMCGSQQQSVGCRTQCTQNYMPATENVGMTCESGFILQNGFCVRKVDVSCPPGSTVEGGNCIVTHSTRPTCPLGSELRGGICVKVFDYVCPYGYNLERGECLRSETIPINCPPGSVMQNNECVRFECPRNFRLESGICVAVSGRIQTECKTVCPAGYYLHDNVCYSNETTVIGQTPPFQLCPNSGGPSPPTTCGNGGNSDARCGVTCPIGTVARGDKCESIACPPPTVWNGQSCVYFHDTQGSKGVNTTNVVNNTHIVHNVNNVTHDTNVNVNNLNNVYIYKGGEVIRISNGTTSREILVTDAPPVVDGEPEVEQDRCCTVVTPRVCKQVNGRWRCFNRKYQRCGPFCTQPVIQLRPQQPIYRPQVVVMPPMPPIPQPCGPFGCKGPTNCSGCQSGGHCSHSCYEYSCSSDCMYQDHQSFCDTYPGPGCSRDDGCYI